MYFTNPLVTAVQNGQSEQFTISVLSSPHFHDEAKAFEYLESIVWADGATCPHCGVTGGRVYDLSGVRTKPSAKNPEGKVRHGLKKCGECRKQFTAKVGTVFEHARMPLFKMLQAVHLMVSSKKGISAHQLSRVLEVQYKSAWFLAHRIREAMRSGDLAQPFGGNGGAVEVDETYIGFKPDVPTRRGTANNLGVVALVPKVVCLGSLQRPQPLQSRTPFRRQEDLLDPPLGRLDRVAAAHGLNWRWVWQPPTIGDKWRLD